MNDMRATIIPKSDQMNFDDFAGGTTKTITVTKVLLGAEAEQPVSVGFEGDNGKPYKPCKSMRRVMVNVWGPDASKYTGRSMTLYGDPTVIFGGAKVGGIRISHMSHLDAPMTMALTATKATRKPFTVKPLVVDAPKAEAEPKPRTVEYPNRERIAYMVEQLGMPDDLDTLTHMYTGFWPEVKVLDAKDRAEVDKAKDDRKAALTPSEEAA